MLRVEDVVDVFVVERRRLGLGGGAGLRRVCLRWCWLAVLSRAFGLGGSVVVLGGFVGGPSSLDRDRGGGTSFLDTLWLLSVPESLTCLAAATCLGGGGLGFSSGRSTLIQSDSGLAENGFDGLFGFGTWFALGGFNAERAGIPLSSHHFLLSELAGGRPGSIDS